MSNENVVFDNSGDMKQIKIRWGDLGSPGQERSFPIWKGS
jgi:hypothetical protein